MLDEMRKFTTALSSLYGLEQNSMGEVPGVVKIKPDQFAPLKMSIVHYSQYEFSKGLIEDIKDVKEFRQKDTVSWLTVIGLGDNDFLERLRVDLGLHGLVIEDIVKIGQPPKVEFLSDSIFIVLRLPSESSERLDSSISLILQDSNLFLFSPSGDFTLSKKLTTRIEREKGAIRKKGVDYLLFALIDIVVDSYFPKIDLVTKSIKEIDQNIFDNKNSHLLHEIKTLRQVLNVYYDNLVPIKEIIEKLLSDDGDLIQPENVKYFNHASNHVTYLSERIVRLKESTSDIMNLSISMNGQKMNEIMKVLTMMSSVFIPLSFLCGLYGMNFDTSKSPYNMPELAHYYGYPILLSVMGSVIVVMFFYFYKKKWF